jgi:hypothetical protein
MTITPEGVSTVAIIILLAGSETLSLLPIVKSNGWIQLILAALRGIAKWK